MASKPHRLITDDLLSVSIRIKREAGVGHAQIQEVIDRFASREQWQERTGGIGFPTIEDIPQDGRAAFMAALAELGPHPEQAVTRAARGRTLSANEIWPSRIA